MKGVFKTNGPSTSASAEAIQRKIANEDPNSTIKFSLAHFPINDLLNNDSFITLYPDVLDIIFYNPEIVGVLQSFNTASGFLCNINSLKEVKLANWITKAVSGKKGEKEDDMASMKAFLTTYMETQLFNALLKNTSPDEHVKLDPQEYFDEVASACAQALAKNIQPETVKPQLFESGTDYSVYPVSQSVCRNNMLKNVGIVITLAGNIGVEKVSGSFWKKGKISVLVDISVKVIVFNTYIFSKRGLTLVLNGIRERKRVETRMSLLDENIERQQNEVSEAMAAGRRFDSGTKKQSFITKVAQEASNSLLGEVQDRITTATGGMNRVIADVMQ